MAEKPKPTSATPQSITTSPPAPQTPHSTSPPSDSEDTEYQPTPLHSPGGPQYEDLPPSYDFALSDAQNGVASLDASQIEAHRVSANEGPDDPEVWEYRMRGEAADEQEEAVHEVAPAYEGHVPVQHVAHSENIAVGRVQGSAASTSTAGGASAPAYEEDPPHSVPQGAGSESQRGQPWSPFGAGHGPFGAPGNGPFGDPCHGPFGASGSRPFGFGAPGHAPNGPGQRGRRGPGRRGRGGRSSSSQDGAAFGQNMGRWGEELERRMRNWGEQVGRQAGAMGEQIGRQAGAMGQQVGRQATGMGQQIGRQAGAMGQQVGRQAAGMGQQLGRDTGAWAAAYLEGATARARTTSNTATATASSSVQVQQNSPPRYDDLPTYSNPAGAGGAGQETGVLHSNSNSDPKAPPYPAEKAPAYPAEENIPQSPSEKPSSKSLELGKQKPSNDFDSSSSISSDSSDSSDSSLSSSSSDDNDDVDAAQSAFLARIASIERAAESAYAQGKKPPEEIAHERGLAIAKATREKEVAEQRRASRAARREQKKELRSRKRELMREYRTKRREARGRAEGKGKGKGKAKKGAEWRELKREYKAKRRALKRERMDAKRAWKRERREEKRGVSFGGAVEQKVLNEKARDE